MRPWSLVRQDELPITAIYMYIYQTLVADLEGALGRPFSQSLTHVENTTYIHTHTNTHKHTHTHTHTHIYIYIYISRR